MQEISYFRKKRETREASRVSFSARGAGFEKAKKEKEQKDKGSRGKAEGKEKREADGKIARGKKVCRSQRIPMGERRVGNPGGIAQTEERGKSGEQEKEGERNSQGNGKASRFAQQHQR